jgi:hypothetical protein
MYEGSALREGRRFLGLEVEGVRINFVRMMSKGDNKIAVMIDAETATARDAIGWVLSEISLTPGSGRERIAERKEVVHASPVETRTW